MTDEPDTEHPDDGARYIDIMRIHGTGTLPGLLDCIREQHMAGRGIRFATSDWKVVDRICVVADRMGGSVSIDLDPGCELESIQVLPAPEPSQARH